MVYFVPLTVTCLVSVVTNNRRMRDYIKITGRVCFSRSVLVSDATLEIAPDS
jgi:hypothetical protein